MTSFGVSIIVVFNIPPPLTCSKKALGKTIQQIAIMCAKHTEVLMMVLGCVALTCLCSGAKEKN